MVVDDHQRAGGEAGVDAAGGVGEDQGPDAEQAQDPHGEGHASGGRAPRRRDSVRPARPPASSRSGRPPAAPHGRRRARPASAGGPGRRSSRRPRAARRSRRGRSRARRPPTAPGARGRARRRRLPSPGRSSPCRVLPGPCSSSRAHAARTITNRSGDRCQSRNPAIVAVMKLARVPANIARSPSRARSCRRFGASAPMPPIWMPIELKLAKPQSAKVAIVNDCGSSDLLRAARAARRRRTRSAPSACPAGCRWPGRRATARPSPGDRREDPAEDLLQAEVRRGPSSALTSAISARNEMSMAPTLSARCSPSLVPRPAASMTLTSVCSHLEPHRAHRLGRPGLGDEHLRHHDRARGRHDDGRQQVLRLDAEEDVGRHDAARDVRHPGRHHRHQLRLASSRAGTAGSSAAPRSAP